MVAQLAAASEKDERVRRHGLASREDPGRAIKT
jgi:hypothetical protein